VKFLISQTTQRFVFEFIGDTARAPHALKQNPLEFSFSAKKKPLGSLFLALKQNPCGVLF